MKYLIWLLILGAFWWWWRQQQMKRERRQHPPSTPTATSQGPQEMVHCPVCGLHLPRQDSVAGRIGTYCSEEHRVRNEG